jgi:hypothetical protein
LILLISFVIRLLRDRDMIVERARHLSEPQAMDWTESEMQIAILQVLLAARKQNPRSGDVSQNKLKETLHINNVVTMQKVMQELSDLVLIEKFGGDFHITAKGVDYLEENLPSTRLTGHSPGQAGPWTSKSGPDSPSGVPA